MKRVNPSTAAAFCPHAGRHIVLVVLALLAPGSILRAQSTPGSTAKIYWTDANFSGSIGARVWRANLDGSGIQPLVVPGGVNHGFMSVNPDNGKIYWADGEAFTSIRRANLDGTGVETVVREVAPMGVAVDPAAGQVYWTNFYEHAIKRSNLDGSDVQTLVTLSTRPLVGSPQGIAVDASRRPKMYWANSDQGSIQRANLDGTQVEDVVGGLSFPQGIALDRGAGKIYWTSGQGIQRSNLDGTSIEIVVPGLSSPVGVALDTAARKLYWTTLYPPKIQRANLDGSQVEDIVTEGLGTPWGIAIVTSVPVPNDATPPDTTITSGPGEGSTIGLTASFTFAGSDDQTLPVDLIFECSLDGSPFDLCVSPVVYALEAGRHTFAVRATDRAANHDPTPASRTWSSESRALKGVLDQQQPLIDATTGGLSVGGFYRQKLAQIVTAGVAGRLAEVRLPLPCPPDTFLEVQIQGVTGDTPNGIVLASQLVPGTLLPYRFPGAADPFNSIFFDAPASFEAGDRFAIVLDSPGDCGIFRSPVGDTYAGGNLYFDTRPNPEGVWVCVCDFAGDRFDLPFQTFVAPANHDPAANAGPDVSVECASPAGTEIHLDGSGSTDADSNPGTHDDIIAFEWFRDLGLSTELNLGSGERLSVTLPLGTHRVSVRVTDTTGASGTDEVLVSVLDTTPPALICPAPAAAECAGPGGVPVELVASASDTCAGAVAIVNDRTPGGADASDLYPLGTTQVRFTATDPSGNAASCTSPISVLDTTPPVLAVRMSRDLLWPPNHRLLPLTAAVAAEDVCDTSPGILLESVGSDEPDDAPGIGDGETTSDIQDASLGEPDLEISLRAERAGTGDGRVYSVRYRATDRAGNAAMNTALVTVPHDQAGSTEPLLISLRPTGPGTVIEWSAVIGAIDYTVVRGTVEALRITPEAIDLGPITCLEAHSLDASTVGHEDADAPVLGRAFFYVVSYNDGLGSSFGSEAAPKPRDSQSAGCQ